MEQILVCKKCGKECGTRESKTKCRKTHILVRSCAQCYQAHRERMRIVLGERNRSAKMREASSKNMRCNNPMFNPDIAHKVAETNKEQYRKGERISLLGTPEVRAKTEAGLRAFWASSKSDVIRSRFSKRMKRSNPMYDQQTLKKAMHSMAEGRSSGRIVTPKGKDHWLWKGNRRFNLVVRSRLYKVWTIPVIIRDHFTCTLCGRTDCSLQAHHSKSLASIIESVLKREGVENVEALKETSRYSFLADLVVAEHHLEDGITVCRKCHAMVDRQYKSHEKPNQNGLSQRMTVIKNKQSLT